MGLPRRLRLVLALSFAVGFAASAALGSEIPEGVKNSQNPDDKPLSPAEALKRIELPEGFRVTLFAAEPDVAQPIAMAFDDRGRLWVAECYSYKEWDQKGKKGHDRILIFEDEDNDGEFDKRKIFADNLPNLTGLEIGFGGVWACSAPNLLFFPDANRDDVPDGKPQVKLDGWVIKKVGHNIFNGLTWGPDGWLYGCHGIQDESLIGTPGTPDEKRVQMRCGIWRYHPVKEKVEVVCHGTTNPWGLDFDENGEGFFTNCVIGHLWHMIPGAHFKRMYGEDYNRYAYELIDQHADHLHWAGGKWTDSRGNKPEHSKAGGGHAHVGAMIYLGDNWPSKYRKMVGMCNVHGQRLNFDQLERQGSGYVGHRGEDLFFAHDEWFRGVSVMYGPDGAVYISDWCDYGECHDNDGVHRTSGRIYRVTYEWPQRVSAVPAAPSAAAGGVIVAPPGPGAAQPTETATDQDIVEHRPPEKARPLEVEIPRAPARPTNTNPPKVKIKRAPPRPLLPQVVPGEKAPTLNYQPPQAELHRQPVAVRRAVDRRDRLPTSSEELMAGGFDITKMDNKELCRLQMVPNAWWGRRARLELQHRAARGDDMQSVHKLLWAMTEDNFSLRQQMRSLWALHVAGGLDDVKLMKLLDHQSDVVRGWAVKLLSDDGKVTPEQLERFAAAARDDNAWVRLKLASALQRLPLEDRWPISAGLVSHEEDNDDHNLPLMIWYGIEPAVAVDKPQALKLAAACKISKVRQFIAKRVAEGSK